MDGGRTAWVGRRDDGVQHPGQENERGGPDIRATALVQLVSVPVETYCLTVSTSIEILTSSPTNRPPVSVGAFHVRPKSFRLIFVFAS